MRHDANLQQALETLHAPDAAAVMASSAVDVMLKQLGLAEGNVYSRIERAVSEHMLTGSMGDQAKQSVEFAEAFGHFLFVLSSRVKKGIEDAAKADEVPPARRPRARKQPFEGLPPGGVSSDVV